MNLHIRSIRTLNIGALKDSDKDGVPDKSDRCPGTPAGIKVTVDGCPIDSDRDGIADYLDKCPDVTGLAAFSGCPEVKEEVIKVFTQALTEFNLVINGHTDNVGDDAKNLDLSQRRADAVKKYLADNGVEAGRITSKGFGETEPVADNNTAAGRTKNRRVEFKVNF